MSAGPLSPYRSPEHRRRAVRDVASAAGGEVVPYGQSVEGEALEAVRVPSSRGASRRVLCSANIHGPEWIGCEVALALLQTAADAGSPAAALLHHAELWVVPCLNPDGYRRTFERQGVGPLVHLRTNAHGVDLNRNYPLPGGARRHRLPGSGSTTPGDTTYVGPAPLSEPETAALDRLCAEQGFWASTNLHSFMGTMIPAHVDDRPCFRHYARLCRAMADAQPRHRYRRLAARVLDTFTGEQEDHQHHVHDTWAVCIEVFPVLASYRQHWRPPSTFWRFNPHDPGPWIDNDLPGVIAWLRAALDSPRPSELRAQASA
ncbi:M14 family metallopeptidase [Paraliomyxa miuraensis]|uniref:M14 family metallopeptidase n=1 Tax=Paraliomyxa miuraensis TaxID=376150 RepID=UPI00224DB7BF|nr:M14 family metallopeptidase [Paraliomyxa miuraensis]MCX4244557.1 M14 family metallopeptidase [Paraliomyxa miuraensis]